MSTRRVVVGVSPVEPRPELVTWAAAEAHARQALLDVVTACPSRTGAERQSVARAVLSWAAALATDQQPGLAIHTRAVPGPPEDTLRAEASGADLLVIGADDQSPFVEAITGSVPGALLTTAPCPLVVVPKGVEAPNESAPVLVGVDTTETSRAALDYAFAAATRLGRALQVVLCWPAPRDRTGRLADRAEQQRALALVLTGFADRHPGVAVTEQLVDGDPTEELSRRSRRAALIVLGSHGRGRLASVAFGSVSRTLIRLSHCPVAVVRPNPLPAAGMAS